MTGKRRAEANDPRPGQHIPTVKPGTGEGDPRAKQQKNRRPGPRHYAPDPPKDATPKAPRASRKPTSSAPVSSPPRGAPRAPAAPAGPGPRRRLASDEVRRLAAEGHEYASRQAIRATTARPSVTGRAAAGGAAGAATGAAIGSVVGGPGVGTAVGGGIGAVAGGVAGGSAKKAYKRALRPNTGARRVVVAEFVVCVVIAALSPLTDRRREEPPSAFMRRMAAIMGVFFILALMSAGGRGLAKFAAGLGGLITVALLVSERSVFTTIGGIFGRDNARRAPAKPPESVGGTVGSVAVSGIEAGGAFLQ